MKKLILFISIILLLPFVLASSVYFEFLPVDNNNVKHPEANCTLNVTDVKTDTIILNSAFMGNRSNGFHNYSWDFEESLYYGEIYCWWDSNTARDAFSFEVNETEFRYSKNINETLENINQTHLRYLSYINKTVEEGIEELEGIDVGGGGGTGVLPCPTGYKTQKDEGGGTWCVPKSSLERFIENNFLFIIIIIIILVIVYFWFEGKLKQKRDEYLERRE